MFSTRLINLLLVALSIFAIAQATYVDVKIIREQSREVVRRQDGDSSVAADATTDPSTSEPNTSKTTDPTSPSSTPSPTDDTTSKPTKPPSSTEKPPPSSTEKTDTTPTPSNTEGKETSTHPISTVTHVVTETRKDGSKTTRTETDASPTAGLQDGSGKGTSSGMSTSTRNIVIGVVVGVGGAIVLGGIALVAFRIWGRKKSQHENEDIGYDPGYQPVEKSDAGNSPNGRSPFQSTLESYHAPTQVNTASNF